MTQTRSEPVKEASSERLLLGRFDVPRSLLKIGCFVALVLVALWSVQKAYTIRLHAIKEYGPLIHEFDPWFNYRATEYLAKHGSREFFQWFDHESWYPLGRPVGTTIYPAMQFTAVWIFNTLRFINKNFIKGVRMSLNDVCAYIPCWGGAVATVLLGLLAYEVSDSVTAGVVGLAIMAVIPAHLMRSIGGGFDNESVAMSALVGTFYLWMRALRTPNSWAWGAPAGLVYGYMVWAWGGYIFVINLVALHAGILLLSAAFRGDSIPGVVRAYSLLYAIGTAIGISLPVVGWTPLRSLEQMLPLAVFVGLIVFEITDRIRVQRGIALHTAESKALRVQALKGCVAGFMVFLFVMYFTGKLGPMSARVRGLFVRHTRTGNPLVDSVAEHQPASFGAYVQNLHIFAPVGVVGWWLLLLRAPRMRQASFLLVYGAVTSYFSLRMSRLVLLIGPAAAALSAVVIGWMFDYIASQAYWSAADGARARKAWDGLYKQMSKAKTFQAKATLVTNTVKANSLFIALAMCTMLPLLAMQWAGFLHHSERIAEGLSYPQIVYKAYTHDGRAVLVDDYLKAYEWLRDNTPEDARVMAWWDYGYQITGIGRRTTIADGNTWNHEHIATLGVCMSSKLKKSWSLIRYLADYVLIWTGSGHDDLAKSTHMARIGNSVYPGHCGDDPTCSSFGFDEHGNPTPMMRESLLYNLDKFGDHDGGDVKVPSKYFTLVHTTQYGKVKIYKVMNVSEESKEWIANNKQCDAPGSWYCPGQYPPAEVAPELAELLARKHDFAQLEDFHSGKKNEKYHQEYMRRMSGRG